MSSTSLEKMAHKQWEEAYLESSPDFDDVRRAAYKLLHRKRLWVYETVGGGSTERSIAAPPITIADLVAYWKMDEGNGTRIDATGNGNNLVPFNLDVPSDTGKIGLASKAALVDAVHPELGYALVCTSSVLDDVFIDADHTVCFWFNKTGNAINLIGKSKWADVGEHHPLHIVYVEFQGRGVSALAGDTSSVYFFDGHIFSDNTWHFVEYSYESITTTFRLRVDNGNPVSIVKNSPPVKDATVPFQVGCIIDNITGDAPFTASDVLIDELLVIDRLLTDDERNALWNSGNGITLFP